MSGFIAIERGFSSNPVFKDSPVSLRMALLWIADRGRIVRVTVGDLSKGWCVAERRAVQIVNKLQKSGFISVHGEGRCRLICIETSMIETCGFYVSQGARYTKGAGGGKWRGASLPKQVRNAVLERDNHTCAYCGVTDAPMHIDHIKPVLRGGTDAMANLTAACAPCNLSKGGKALSEWRADK